MDTGGMNGRPRLGGRGRVLVAGVAIVVLIAAFWIIFRSSAMDTGSGDKKLGETAGAAAASTVSSVALSTPVKQSLIFFDTSLDPRATKIRIGTIDGVLSPSARGGLPRVPVAASASIEARIPIPNATPGERIGIQAGDEGLLSRASGGLSIC